MTDKVNGKASAGEFLGSNLDFYIVTSTTRFDNDQALLDKVVETISLNGQPVILAAPTWSSPTCTIKFAIEHASAWSSAALIAALQAPGIALAGVTATITPAMS